MPWLACIEGEGEPDHKNGDDAADLRRQHSEIAARWLAMTRGVERRGNLMFSAHRRQLARRMMAQASIEIAHLNPDPIMWKRRDSGGML